MIKKFLSIFLSFAFFSLSVPQLQASELPFPSMPQAGAMVFLSHAYTPAHLQGMIIDPHNPLQFNFLVHRGDSTLNDFQKHQEYQKLIKYFLASLTTPDDDQWVNLSPYEKNRIISQDFGLTEMGRDLLTQDYLLKQITSSLIYPEASLGKEFWNKVYERSTKLYGSTAIPINTFNKVWITPDEAIVYESGNTAYIIKTHLKVMLEEDYLSLKKHVPIQVKTNPGDHRLASEIIKQIILPELEKEVNEGQNFALLRQIYSSMVLATWYKKSLKESLLGRIYADRSKVRGVDQDPRSNGLIYRQYLMAFKKGVFNYIKEDYDAFSHQEIPRKYFAGGWSPNDSAMRVMTQQSLKSSEAIEFYQSAQATSGKLDNVTILLNPAQLSQGPKSYKKALIGGGIVALVAAAGIGKVLLTPHQNQPSPTPVVIKATVPDKDKELSALHSFKNEQQRYDFFFKTSLVRLLSSSQNYREWYKANKDEVLGLGGAVSDSFKEKLGKLLEKLDAVTVETSKVTQDQANAYHKAYDDFYNDAIRHKYFLFIHVDGPTVNFKPYVQQSSQNIIEDNQTATVRFMQDLGDSLPSVYEIIHDTSFTMSDDRSLVFLDGMQKATEEFYQSFQRNLQAASSISFMSPQANNPRTQFILKLINIEAKDIQGLSESEFLKLRLKVVAQHEARHQIDLRLYHKSSESRALAEEITSGGYINYSLGRWLGYFGTHNLYDQQSRKYFAYDVTQAYQHDPKRFVFLSHFDSKTYLDMHSASYEQVNLVEDALALQTPGELQSTARLYLKRRDFAQLTTKGKLIGGATVIAGLGLAIGLFVSRQHSSSSSPTQVNGSVSFAYKDEEIAAMQPLDKPHRVGYFMEHSLDRLIDADGTFDISDSDRTKELLVLAKAADPELGGKFASFITDAKAYIAHKGKDAQVTEILHHDRDVLDDYLEPYNYAILYNGFTEGFTRVRMNAYGITQIDHNIEDDQPVVVDEIAMLDPAKYYAGAAQFRNHGGGNFDGTTFNGKRSYFMPDVAREFMDTLESKMALNFSDLFAQQYQQAISNNDQETVQDIENVRKKLLELVRRDIHFPNQEARDNKIKAFISDHEGQHQLDYRHLLKNESYVYESRGHAREVLSTGLPYYSLAIWVISSFNTNEEYDLADRLYLFEMAREAYAKYQGKVPELKGFSLEDFANPKKPNFKLLFRVLNALGRLPPNQLAGLSRQFLNAPDPFFKEYLYSRRQHKIDRASVATVLNPTPYGGIDLNANNMNLIIKRDAHGLPLPVSQQDLAQLSRISGFIPRILDIQPLSQPLGILQEIESRIISTNPHSN